MTAVSTTAVILAGGRSRRFGSDKLVAELDGSPLLHHALRAVAMVADELVLVIAHAGDVPLLPDELGRRTIVVRDEAEHPGPLAALLTGARTAHGPAVLLVAGDMPALQPALLARLLAWRAADGACLMVGGERQILPLGLDRASVIAEADRLLTSGERSLRALVARLALEEIAEPDWRALDCDALSLRDIDRPEDLASRS